MFHVLLLLGCAIAIYLACEWFVNAVEWLGAQLKVGPVAVGTVLAAVGTALPESVVTLVAVASGGGESHKDIGIGAAMGGPLALSTVAYAVAGFMLWRVAKNPTTTGGSRTLLANVDLARLGSDQAWFLGIFVCKVGLGLVAFAFKPWLGILFFLGYITYFIKELRAEGKAETEELEPLKLQPKQATPSKWAVVLQCTVTLVIIFFASQLFVAQLAWAGPKLGLPSSVVALLLSPIATELPEIMNAVIWIRQRKISLALANISGAMMIQATVPSGIAIIFTKWKFDGPLILSGILTGLAILYLLTAIRFKRFSAGILMGAGLFYVAFAFGLTILL